MAGLEVVGYLHIIVEYLKIDNAKGPIHANISMGDIAKVDTTSKASGSTWNQVFLIQVPKEPARFLVNVLEGQTILGECRYDIRPFIERNRITHTLDSQLFGDHNGDHNANIGHAKLKLTYYSADNGKLKIRIFHLEFHPETIQQYKQAKVKVVSGFHAQSTEVRPLTQPFDETVEVLLLDPTANLSLEVIHDKGVLASYTYHNIKQSGILCEQSKAYQVSLLNHKKPIGFIKYQITWIK